MVDQHKDNTPGRSHDVEIGGRRRRYRLHAPDLRDPATAAGGLVIELHGSGFTPEAQMAVSGFAALADHLGFRVVAPEAAIPFHYAGQAAPGFAWHVPGVPLFGQTRVGGDWPDDLAFLISLIEALARDDEPVFVAGFSGGGRLAAHLAFRLGDRIGAIGTVAGLVLPPDDGRALPPPWFSFIVCCETAVALAMESDALTLGACTVGTPIKVPRPLNSNNASAARVINRPSARRHCWRPLLLGKNELL